MDDLHSPTLRYLKLTSRTNRHKLPGVSTGSGHYPMKVRPKFCRTCGNPPAEGDRISFRGYCRDCAVVAIGESGRQLQAKEGPYYEQWRASYRQSLERQLRSLS